MFDDFEKPIYPEFYGNPDEFGGEANPKPPLPAVSLKLRSWRGHSGLRVAAPLLSGEIGTEVNIRAFANIESGHLERVPAAVLAKITEYLNR